MKAASLPCDSLEEAIEKLPIYMTQIGFEIQRYLTPS
jgi:hypothetical protein